MEIQIINKSKHETPPYSTEASAWMDLRANIAKHENAKLVCVDSLKETDRGAGGFGHTRKK